MSIKGKQFTAGEAPSSVEDKEAWATAQTERWRIVAMDGDVPLIAEELAQRALNKMSSKARRAAGALVALEPAVRLEVLSAFAQDGEIVMPFTPVP